MTFIRSTTCSCYRIIYHIRSSGTHSEAKEDILCSNLFLCISLQEDKSRPFCVLGWGLFSLWRNRLVAKWSGSASEKSCTDLRLISSDRRTSSSIDCWLFSCTIRRRNCVLSVCGYSVHLQSDNHPLVSAKLWVTHNRQQIQGNSLELCLHRLPRDSRRNAADILFLGSPIRNF